MLDAIDLTSTQTSESTHVLNLDRASVHIDWSGSDAVGEVQFEAKKQVKDKSQVDSDWQTLDFGSTISISGASGTHQIIFDSLDFTHLRVKFVYTSGTSGSLNAVLTAKQIGG